MNISNSYLHGITYAKSAAAERSSRSETPASFADCLDQVTISKEARKMGWDYENLAAVAADLKAYNKQVNDQTAEAVSYDRWLPENLEKLHEIWSKIDQLQAADGNPNPHTRSDASHKKMWDYHSQIAVLEVYGESKVVTDKMLLAGAAAYREGEREWGAANGWQTEEWAEEGSVDSLLKNVLRPGYGDPEELEKRLEEWKSRQLTGEGPSQTKQAFTQYMDKALGRGKPEPPKSPEERIKELNAKIKTLQSRLSEVVADPGLPEASRAGQVETINAQIQSLYAQIAELVEFMAQESAPASA